jgi:DNA processing protein
VTGIPDEPLRDWLRLVHTPGLGPRRMARLLESFGSPAAALQADARGWAAAGVSGTPGRGETASAVEAGVEADLEWLQRDQRHHILTRDDPGYPSFLAELPDPPPALYLIGDPEFLRRPQIAIVGSREATPQGLRHAESFARNLSAAGLTVTSGLALGIDGAAHRGALEAGAAGGAPPVGVVGSGLDVTYPARHRALWGEVAAAGALLSEAPLGARPEPWRFPARNRVIAGLSEVVVVVESHTSGGSLHTVDEAADRGVPVMAVPGSVRSPASDGTNQLLHDGCAPVRGADDVLDALPARWSDRPVVRGPAPEVGLDVGPRPVGDAAAVLDALGGEPAALEQLAVRTGLDLGPLAVALEQLVAAGRVQQTHGWFERVHR